VKENVEEEGGGGKWCGRGGYYKRIVWEGGRSDMGGRFKGCELMVDEGWESSEGCWEYQ
jgi:hypothetical protein